MDLYSFSTGIVATFAGAFAFLAVAYSIDSLGTKTKPSPKRRSIMAHCGNPNCPTCKPQKQHVQIAEELEDRIHSIQRDLEARTADTVTVDFDVVLIMRVITAIRAPQTLSQEDKDHLNHWTLHVVKQFPLPPQDLDLLKRIWLLGE